MCTAPVWAHGRCSIHVPRLGVRYAQLNPVRTSAPSILLEYLRRVLDFTTHRQFAEMFLQSRPHWCVVEAQRLGGVHYIVSVFSASLNYTNWVNLWLAAWLTFAGRTLKLTFRISVSECILTLPICIHPQHAHIYNLVIGFFWKI